MSMWAVHAKRKEPEETVVELLRNVSLSPPKRLRVTDSWVPTKSWPTPSFEPEVEVQSTPPQADALIFDEVPLSPPSSPSPPPLVATANHADGTEEKAIILYKPVNPPLFPGGPPTGSSETPFIVDTTGVLAACKGTGNHGSSVVDAGHASSALNSSPDAHIWTGLFEALDLQGKKPLLPTRRLQRTSSCSSLPQLSSSMDDTSMDEETAAQPRSQLALVPYSPSPFLAGAVQSGASHTVSSNAPGSDHNEEMIDEVDAMDVAEESMPAGDGLVGAAESGSQFGSPIPTFGSAQWEPCDMFKAPYSKVMWSH